MKKSNFISYSILGIISLGLIYFLYYELEEVVENNQMAMNYISKEGLKPDWQNAKALTQQEAAKYYQTFHQFSFTNQLEKSQISFQHLVNLYAGIEHRPIHYDHGNGMTVGDVDKDGQYDIFFVSQLGNSELWRNQGNGTFEDITTIAGLDIVSLKTCISASFADIDNDGDPDLYITTIREGNFLFENDGDGVFKDISTSANVNFHGHSSSATFFDYNRDGLLDLFLTNVGVYTTNEVKGFKRNGVEYEYYVGVNDAFAGHLKSERSEPSLLYKNLGNNQFKEVSKEVGLVDDSWIGDAHILDANEDGFMDLYLINMQGNDEYFENVNGAQFLKKSRALFPKTSWGAMGIEVFDFNNDGMQDIYIVDMHSDMGENATLSIDKEKEKIDAFPEEYLQTNGANISGNSFFKKIGNNRYEEVSDAINAENYWPWGISSGDLNADGYVDIFVTKSMNYPFRYTENAVLLNENGERFLDSEYILGVEPRLNGAYAKKWFELDCDGKDKEHKHCHGKTGKVMIWGALGSRSSVIFDLDDDGDLDIVTNEYNDVPMVLTSNLSEKKKINYLKVKLEGTTSNRDGIKSLSSKKAVKI